MGLGMCCQMKCSSKSGLNLSSHGACVRKREDWYAFRASQKVVEAPAHICLCHVEKAESQNQLKNFQLVNNMLENSRRFSVRHFSESIPDLISVL